MLSRFLTGWKERVRLLKRDVRTIYLALRHPRSPWYAKAAAFCVVGYACSPIDLIPDCIPILGYLDDLVIVPFGIALTLRMIPPDILAECRQQADLHSSGGKPIVSWLGAAFVIAMWLVILGLTVHLAMRLIGMPR